MLELSVRSGCLNFSLMPLCRIIPLLTTVLFALAGGLVRSEEAPASLVFRVGKKAMVIMTPKTIRRITIEEQTAEGWVPLSVKHLPATRRSELVVVQLPRIIPKTKLRALGYRTDRFPNLTGASDYPGSVSAGPASPDVLRLDSATGGVALQSANLGTPTLAPVVESDIWKLVGHRLFFFNQYRGLQVIDLAAPLHPIRTGTLRMAARGELFYALDAGGDRLALLSRTTGAGSKPMLELVSIKQGVPVLDKRLALGDGAVIDSRLVGGKLYLLVKEPDSYGWWGASYSMTPGRLRLLTVDVSSNTAASVLDERAISVQNGYYFGYALQIQDGHLMVLVPEAQQMSSYYWDSTVSTTVQVFSLDGHAGKPVPLSFHQLRGFASDKFKCAIMDGHLVATSVTNSRGNFAQPTSETWVQVFDPKGPNNQPIGEVELPSARGERLYATRYDGHRAYVVTFRNTDPLFIVDLAVPARPVVTGELEIPGWSTYLMPHGDRLLSVGVESGRVAVSLFDVSAPESTSLLARVYPGGDNASWSEANYDEKAVEYDAATGTLMVPFQTWSGEGWGSFIQEISVGPDSLTLGRSIRHQGAARRGSVLGDHLVSISGKELVVLDRASGASDPLVTLPLSWRVDRVLPLGPFLVQIEQGQTESYFNGIIGFSGRLSGQTTTSAGVVRISLPDDPDLILDQLTLTGGGISGFSVRENRLFLAQQVQVADDRELLTTVLEVNSQGRLSQVEQTRHKVPLESDYTLATSQVEALWPAPTKLVWHAPVQRNWFPYWPWQPGGVIITPIRPLVIDGGVTTSGSGPRSTGTKESQAGDDGNKVPISYLAVLNDAFSNKPMPGPQRLLRTSASNGLINAAKAFAAGGFVFTGYQDSNTRVLSSSEQETEQRWWMQVVDARQSDRLVARHRTSVPGELVSISSADSQGAVVLTKLHDWKWLGDRYEYRLAIHATAYDGVAAWKLDEWSSSTDSWHLPVAADNTRVFVASPVTNIVSNGDVATTKTTSKVMSLGYDPVNRKLGVQGTWEIDQPPGAYSLHAVSGLLLASRWGHLDTASIGTDGSLNPGSSYETPGSLWLPVERAVLGKGLIHLPAFEYGVETLTPLR